MRRSALLTDGMTFDGYLAECELHPAIEFQYRKWFGPARAQVVGEIGKAANAGQFGKGERYIARAIADKLESWDVVDESGEDAEPTADNIEHLEPEVLKRLWEIIVLCEKSPDRKPGENTKHYEDDDDATFRSILSETNADQEREKNSQRA